jgi:colicin import membrane protein
MALCGALALSAGCGKKEGTAPPTVKGTPTPTDAAPPKAAQAADAQQKADAERADQTAQTAEAARVAEAAKTEATRRQTAAETLAAEKVVAAERLASEKVAAAEKLAAEKTAADKLAEAATATAQENARILSLIDSAKNLTGQNKYAEALKILSELSNLKLSPEQQTLVDGLKKTAEQQAVQAVADKAAPGTPKAIGDILGGKK